jgi:hypothetical protein
LVAAGTFLNLIDIISLFALITAAIIETSEAVWNKLTTSLTFLIGVWEVIVFALSANLRRLASKTVVKNGRAHLALVRSINEVVVHALRASCL